MRYLAADHRRQISKFLKVFWQSQVAEYIKRGNSAIYTFEVKRARFQHEHGRVKAQSQR